MKKIVFLSLPLVALIIAFPVFSPSKEGGKVMVADISDNSKKFNQDTLTKAAEYLRAQLIASDKFTVVDFNLQKKKLAEIQKTKKLNEKECRDKECQLQLGREVDASSIVRLNITEFAGVCTLTGELIGIEKGLMVKGVAADFACSPKEMREALVSISRQLSGAEISKPTAKPIAEKATEATPANAAPAPIIDPPPPSEVQPAPATVAYPMQSGCVRSPSGRGGPMCLVPAGEFMMGCNPAVDSECSSDEKPVHTVYLDAFYMDQHEVTVGEYADCVTNGKCTPPSTGSTCNWGSNREKSHPLNCVDWNQAKAYCEFVGKVLPTEAQWEKAARGTDGRKFPWGNVAATCDRAVIYENGQNGCGRETTWPICSKTKGMSPYGICDMAGNVWEWTADWYSEEYYATSPRANPKGPASGYYRVVRGGEWGDYPTHARTSRRYSAKESKSHVSYGFRCAAGAY